MAFGRRKNEPEVVTDPTGTVDAVDLDGFVDDLDEEDRAREDAELLAELAREEQATAKASVSRPQGPWDLADAPETETPRVDLGALHLPVFPEIDVRVEVSPEGEVVAATLGHGESALQLNAFAAPKTLGIWAEIRSEIAEALNNGGGQAVEAEGLLGTELRAGVPTEVPGQGVVLAAARFVGIDGPRWFLRGLLTGPCGRR